MRRRVGEFLSEEECFFLLFSPYICLHSRFTLFLSFCLFSYDVNCICRPNHGPNNVSRKRNSTQIKPIAPTFKYHPSIRMSIFTNVLLVFKHHSILYMSFKCDTKHHKEKKINVLNF